MSEDVTSAVVQLTEAVTRLAIAMERLEPAEQRHAREDEEIRESSNRKWEKIRDRLWWAKSHGFTNVRAANVWAKSGLEVEETTADRLLSLELRDCGPVAIQAITEWVSSLMAGKK